MGIALVDPLHSIQAWMIKKLASRLQELPFNPLLAPGLSLARLMFTATLLLPKISQAIHFDPASDRVSPEILPSADLQCNVINAASFKFKMRQSDGPILPELDLESDHRVNVSRRTSWLLPLACSQIGPTIGSPKFDRGPFTALTLNSLPLGSLIE